MVQLILHADAISGFQAAISYLWQQHETFVRLGICFLCEPGVGAQAIHVTAGVDGSLGGTGGVSFVIDTPFVDFPGQSGSDTTGSRGTTCIYVELYTNTLGPLVTILEHPSHHPLVIEFGRQQHLGMTCTRYLTLFKNKKAADVNYVIAQVILSTQTLTYNITALQYLETLTAVLGLCTPLLSFARKNGGCNPVANALSLKQIIHSFTCLTASLTSIYPEVLLQLLLIDLADVSSFTRTVMRTGSISGGSSNNVSGTSTQVTLSISQNTMNEEETRELGEGLAKTCPQLADYIYNAHPETELHLKDSAWAFVGKNILMLLTSYKLNITLFTGITTSLMKRVVERTGQDPTISVSTQTLQLLEAVVGTQRPEGVLLAYDLYHFFRSSLRYIAFCLFLQSDSPFLSFLGISTPYPILSYDLCIDSAGQEFLASAFQNVQGSVYDAALRGLSVHVVRRVGLKTYGQLLLRDVTNHIAMKVDGVFCRSKPPESVFPSTRVGSSIPFSGGSNISGGQDPRLISGTATLIQHPLPSTPTLQSTGYERLYERTGLCRTIIGETLDQTMHVVPDERLMRTPSLQTMCSPNDSHRRVQEVIMTNKVDTEQPRASNTYPFHTPVLPPAGSSPGRLEQQSLQLPLHTPTPRKSSISKTPVLDVPATLEQPTPNSDSKSHEEEEFELQSTPDLPHEPNFISLLLEPSNEDPESSLDLEAALLQTRASG